LIDLDKLSNEEIWDSKKDMAVRQGLETSKLLLRSGVIKRFWFQHGKSHGKTMGKNTENPPWMIHAMR